MGFFLTHMKKRSQKSAWEAKKLHQVIRIDFISFSSTFLCFVIEPRYHITSDDEISKDATRAQKSNLSILL